MGNLPGIVYCLLLAGLYHLELTYLLLNQEQKHGNMQVVEWFSMVLDISKPDFTWSIFLGLITPLKCLYQNSPERKIILCGICSWMLHVSCRISARNEGFQCAISEDFEKFLPFCQSPAVWNPSKFTCLFEVSKYGVGWCWVHQKLCLRGWCWGWFDPRHSGNSQNQPTSKIQLQQWIVFTSQVFYLNFSLFGVLFSQRVSFSVLLGVSHFVTSLCMRYLEEKTPRVFLLENVSKSGLLLLLKRWLAN